MSSLTLNLVSSGLAMLIEALDGDSITFTRIVIGNGNQPSDTTNITGVQNPIIEVGITAIEKYENYAVLTGTYDNSKLDDGFYAYELGVYAKNTAGTESLYAYKYTAEAGYIPSADSGDTVETQISIIASVGEAENVTAILAESAAYASKQELDDHIANYNNPHKVSKSDVGLGNVENLPFNDNAIEITESTTTTNLVGGDTVRVVWGKIKRFFTEFLNHLAASNPHGITCSKIGAAASSHTHAASAITSGTLGIARGGTGATTAAAAANNILADGASAVGGNLVFSNYGASGARGIQGGMASNDNWRVMGISTTSDGGHLELATNDNGNEPIIARQYNDSSASTSAFTTIARTAYLLNASGNTVFPGSCTATSHPTTSDLKVKDVTGEIDKDLAKQIIMGLSPISYHFKDSDRNIMGFGAQHVYQLLQSLGVTESALYEASEIGKEYTNEALDDETINSLDDEKINWTLDYQQLIAPLVAVVQQQQTEIDDLKGKMEGLINGTN